RLRESAQGLAGHIKSACARAGWDVSHLQFQIVNGWKDPAIYLDWPSRRLTLVVTHASAVTYLNNIKDAFQRFPLEHGEAVAADGTVIEWSVEIQETMGSVLELVV